MIGQALRYQVYIEGAKSSDPSALSRVAGAIASRYGLPAQDMAQRMAAGRFRVKSGIDRATAERLADDLESMGALCVIMDEAGQVLPRPGAAPEPAPASPSGGLQSGLSAARDSQQDLGVLGSDGAAFTLATLDGEEDRPPESAAQAAPSSYDASAFAPPDAEEQDLQLAVDLSRPTPQPVAAKAEGSGGITVPMPPSVAPAPSVDAQTSITFDDAGGEPAQSRPPAAPARTSAQRRAVSAARDTASRDTAAGQNPFEKVRGQLADSERARFAVGVFAALLIGFLPAHIFASVRESSAFGEIDAEVRAEQVDVSDLDDWNALDEFRAAQLDRKESKQTSIALNGMFIWALVGGGLAFLWFRKIDWDQYRSPQ